MKKAAKTKPRSPASKPKARDKVKPQAKAKRKPATKATRTPVAPTKKRAAAPRRKTKVVPPTQPKIEAKPLTKVPPPPEWLGDVAGTKWREVAPVIEARGLLEDLDLDALSLYCDSWQQLREADTTIEQEGEFFTTDKGYVGIHPAVLKRRKAVDVIRKLGEQLGLTPRSRRGLRFKAQAGRTDPLAEFLKSKPKGGEA